MLRRYVRWQGLFCENPDGLQYEEKYVLIGYLNVFIILGLGHTENDNLFLGDVIVYAASYCEISRTHGVYRKQSSDRCFG